jgi:hypothetical protein
MRYPQKHSLGTNDLTITIGMEPTARLEIRATDPAGAPIQGAHVFAWPNVRYGEWAATVLLSDPYNLADLFLAKPGAQTPVWGQPVADFDGTTDSTGLAVLANLPSDVGEFAVEHPQYLLPPLSTPGGEKRREAVITLAPGVTNRTQVMLVPRGQTPIRNY